jgi:hypothetical protein
MTLGHLSIGFAAKRFAPRVPLAVLLIATQAIDIEYGLFASLGLERSMSYRPWSHSLIMALGWSLLALLITTPIYQNRLWGLVIGLVVFSHWILDFITMKGLTISIAPKPGLGLGLYNVVFAESD